MRPVLRTLLSSLLLFGSMYLYSQLIANSRYLSLSSKILRSYSENREADLMARAPAIIFAARQRVNLYEGEINRNHLIDGMVVNRGAAGEMLDQCDSLLFSSIRYVSLDKLGWQSRALSAWQAIEESKDHGIWLRHPRCFRSISRDMILGLLIAMTRSPPRFERELSQLMTTIHRNDGFFGTGPVYVSYLSPGLARLMEAIARRHHDIASTIPERIANGYSTAEIEVLATPAGYTAHLGGLTAWLEMELTDQRRSPEEPNFTVLAAANRLIEPFSNFPLTKQRLDWITDQLMKSDHSNLFFRYLRLRSAQALSVNVKLELLNELLLMPQFPSDRLPMDCDRRSDYLWQRADKSLNHDPIPCQVEYAGVDFLWMAALLLENLETSGVMPN